MRLSPARREAVLATLSQAECATLEHDWEGFWARPEQIVPDGKWETCIALAGRGWGKTRSGAEWIRRRVWREGARRLGLIAQTAQDGREVMVEGPSGVCNIGPHRERPIYEPSKKRLTWRNGAVATLFSDEEPEKLRGPQHDTVWVDELVKFRYPRDTWDNMQFGLRIGKPRCYVTTTPKPIPILREILADPTTVVLRGSTYDNVANLAPAFIARVLRKYEGTRLGRQELYAELLGDVPGALWRRDDIEAGRCKHAGDLVKIVVAVDPAATATEDSDETGIVGAGRDSDGRGYVLADRSCKESPLEWARRAVDLYHELTADIIVAERNQGGDMVSTTIHTVDPNVPVKLVWASRGKHTRAQPIASLYEQGRMHHLGAFPDLEDELTTWTPLDDRSPGRLDALVWAFTELFLEPEETGGVLINDPGYQISPY